MKRLVAIATLIILSTAPMVSGCGSAGSSARSASTVAPGATPESMTLSVGTGDSQFLPIAATCYGHDESPELRWSGVPDDTASFVVVMEQTGAQLSGIFHWVVFDIPGSERHLDNGAQAEAHVSGGRQAMNVFQVQGYTGPCPSEGSSQDFLFRVYALNTRTLTSFDEVPQPHQVIAAMKGHVIGVGERKLSYPQR